MLFHVDIILAPTVCLGVFEFLDKENPRWSSILCDGQKTIPLTNGKEFCPKIDKMFGIKVTVKQNKICTPVVAIFFQIILSNLIITSWNY
jgi:hypothetical protein